MATRNPTGDCSDVGAPTATLDIRDQGVVLVHVLTLHPDHLTVVELVRELTGGSTDLAEADRFERAAQDLVSVGLLIASGELLLPTRAALRFNEIVAAGV